MKEKRNLLLALVAFVVLAAVLAGIWLATRPAPVEGAKTITVHVVHADGTKRDFTCRTDEEYLGPVLLAEGIVKGEVGQYGLLIDYVDGERAVWDEDNAYWALYEGEDYAQQGADTTVIHDGDEFSLVYTLGTDWE